MVSIAPHWNTIQTTTTTNCSGFVPCGCLRECGRKTCWQTACCVHLLVGWVLLYVHRNRRLIRDGSPGRLPRLSHNSWSLFTSFIQPFFVLFQAWMCTARVSCPQRPLGALWHFSTNMASDRKTGRHQDLYLVNSSFLNVFCLYLVQLLREKKEHIIAVYFYCTRLMWL